MVEARYPGECIVVQGQTWLDAGGGSARLRRAISGFEGARASCSLAAMPSPSALASPALLLACALVAGCGSKEAPAPAPSAAAATPAKATTPAAATATPTQAPAKAAAGACSLVGSWTGVYPPGPYPFSGHPLAMTFNADGTGSTASDRATSELAWKTDGNAVTFHGTKPGNGGRYSCRVEEEAKITPEFSADCSTMTAHLVSDPCKGRALTINGIALKRK
jgi:hypothetical protein